MRGETKPDRPVVLLGGSIGALSFARSLGRRGIQVSCLGSATDSPMAHTRYARYKALPSMEDREDLWLDALISLGERQRGRGILFPTGDGYVEFTAQHSEELDDLFDFNVVDEEKAAMILNKRSQYKEAERSGIPLPRTFYADERPLPEIADTIDFPCVLKPYQSSRWRRYAGSKLKVVSSRSELGPSYEAMSRIDPEIMVQERIGGGDDQLYGFLAYYDADGKLIAGMEKRKLRQFPPLYGDGSLQVSVKEPRVRDLSRRLLEHLGYRGLVGVEFKRDPEDGLFKLMEINPRSVSGNMLAVGCGLDLPYIAYCDISGLPVPSGMNPRAGVSFVNEYWDLRSFLEYRRAGKMTGSQWLRSLIGPGKVYAFFAADDPSPFMGLVRRTISRRVRTEGRTSQIQVEDRDARVGPGT